MLNPSSRATAAPLNRYSPWRYIFIIVLVVLALVYALPNIYGESPAVQISPKDGKPITVTMMQDINSILSEHHLTSLGTTQSQYDALMRFSNTQTQMQAQDVLQDSLGKKFVVAMNLAPNTPQWLRALGAYPMKYGLDLRGGMYFLLDVDMQVVVDNHLQNYASQLRDSLRQQDLRYSDINVNKNQESILVEFRQAGTATQAHQYIQKNFPGLMVNQISVPQPALE